MKKFPVAAFAALFLTACAANTGTGANTAKRMAGGAALGAIASTGFCAMSVGAGCLLQWMALGAAAGAALPDESARGGAPQKETAQPPRTVPVPRPKPTH